MRSPRCASCAGERLRAEMPAVTIQLSAPAAWHENTHLATAGWPSGVRLDVGADGGPWPPTDEMADGILIRALAAGRAPTTTAPWASRPGSAHATIIGSDPMTTGSFTAWAQRSLLGTANPAIGEVLAWTLPHAVTELELPGDARASHHARTAMRSIGAGLSCLDDVLLATSELTANALQHGGGTPRLTAVRAADRITVALTDHRPDVLPVVVPLRGAVAASGRGMAIVDAISSHWGVTVYHDHKVVWCELACHT